jgi:hypothetical protein
LDPTLANALLSVDPQTGQVSVLYRDGTAGDPLRVATLTDGAWAHQTVATGIQPMIGTDMDSGDDRTQPLWYSTYDGAASVAFSQGDGNVTYQGQVQNDVGVIVASVTTATGQSLTVSNDGAVSGQQIVIARDASGELVIYDGTQQTDYGSDVVNIIVDAINGASLTVGESHGDVTPYGHVTLNGDGSGNTLEVVTAASGTTPPAGTYGTMSYFTPSDMWVSGALIGLSNVSAVWVDGGNDNDYALIDQALPYAVNFNDGSGSNDLFVDLSSVSLVGWQGVSLSGPTGSTTLHVTGTGGDDIFLFGQTSLELGGEDVVTYPGGDINRLLIDGGSGDDSLEADAPPVYPRRGRKLRGELRRQIRRHQDAGRRSAFDLGRLKIADHQRRRRLRPAGTGRRTPALRPDGERRRERHALRRVRDRAEPADAEHQ